MLRRAALAKSFVSEELSAFIIRETRIGELETTLAVTSNLRRLLVTANVVPSSSILVTLIMEALSSSETSAVTRATRLDIPEYGLLHSHCRQDLKSYIALTGWALKRRVLCLLRGTYWVLYPRRLHSS
jgi:hypothetical protein